MTGAEVAKVEPPKPLVPLGGPIADLDAAYRYAAALAQADILPVELRGKPSNVLLVLLYGQQLNIPPVVAIQTIHPVKGRPFISGRLLLAKVREAGHRYVIEHGDLECTVTITRGDTGEVHAETFTLAEAVTAKLCAIKDGKITARSKTGEALPWELYPKKMLMWRAVGNCVDGICPEVRMGFAIEGEEDEPGTDRPTLAKVAAERTDKRATAPEPVTDAELAEQVAQIAEEHTQPPLSEIPPDDPAMVAELVAFHAAEGTQ